MYCKRCVLPEAPPDITLDSQGVCAYCQPHGAGPAPGPRDRGFLETDLTRLLKKYRGKGKYDCLVMCSGGKDSTSALYYLKRRYGMNPLAFMFDHGFEAEDAIANVRRATECLDIDLLMVRSTHMHEFFAEVIRSGEPVPICPPCSMWYMDLTYSTAKQYGIPLIISGWTRGQMDTRARTGDGPDIEQQFHSLSAATTRMIDRVRGSHPKYAKFPRTMAEIKKRYRKFQVLSPHWFLEEDPEDYAAMIRDELGWEPSSVSYPLGSTNCLLNFVSVYISMRHYGFTHYHIEMSQLIRRGELGREEAMAALEVDLTVEPYRSVMEGVLARLGCSWDDLERGRQEA